MLTSAVIGSRRTLLRFEKSLSDKVLINNGLHFSTLYNEN